MACVVMPVATSRNAISDGVDGLERELIAASE